VNSCLINSDKVWSGGKRSYSGVRAASNKGRTNGETVRCSPAVRAPAAGRGVVADRWARRHVEPATPEARARASDAEHGGGLGGRIHGNLRKTREYSCQQRNDGRDEGGAGVRSAAAVVLVRRPLLPAIAADHTRAANPQLRKRHILRGGARLDAAAERPDGRRFPRGAAVEAAELGYVRDAQERRRTLTGSLMHSLAEAVSRPPAG